MPGALPGGISVEFVFGRNAAHQHPERISTFLGTEPTEPTATPVYVNTRALRMWDQSFDATYLSLFFSTNPGYCCGRAGYHEADLEHIVILFDKAPQSTPRWVYFSAHGNGQGKWRAWGQCHFSAKGALRVYVAKQSNAMYPAPGRCMRAMCAASDLADGLGNVFAPSEADFCDAEKQSWTGTHGNQLRRGIDAPNMPKAPPVRGAKGWERMMIVMPNVKKRLASIPCAVVVSQKELTEAAANGSRQEIP